jgi:response regulator of citrate/malate metabolism
MLIIEDEEHLQFYFKDMFIGLFKEIKEAYSANEARDVMKTFAPDIILLDLKMGPFDDRSGLELLREMREGGNKVNVIVVSAVDDPDDIEEAYKLGIRIYLKKPFNLDRLHDAVYDYLREIGRDPI